MLRHALSCLAALALVTAACSVGSDVSERDSNDLSGLTQLADDVLVSADGPYLVTLTNFEQAREAFGYSSASTCATEESLQRYGDEVTLMTQELGFAGTVLFFDMGRDFRAPDREFGIRLCEITMTADNLSSNFGTFLVLRVTSQLDDIDSAIRQDSVWSDLLTSSQTEDGVLYDWGSTSTPERQSTMRPIRVGGQLFVRNDIVIRSDQGATMDAYLAGAGRLVDQPHAREVTASLERRGAVQIMLSNEPYTVGDQPAVAPAEIETFRARDGGLAPWELLGIGLAPDDQAEPRAVVTIAHASEQEARENLDRLSRTVSAGSSLVRPAPWSDVIEIVDIELDGVMVHATLDRVDDRAPFGILLQALFTKDSLFALHTQN